MFLGLRLGPALGGGGEDLVGVRQGGALGAVLGGQPLHQGQKFLLLLLEVQLHTEQDQTHKYGSREMKRQPVVMGVSWHMAIVQSDPLMTCHTFIQSSLHSI